MTPQEQLTPLTYEDAKKTIYDVFATAGVSTTGWKPGFVMRTMIAAVAVVLVVFSELITLIAKSAFLDFAEGQWLTWLARYVYGTERILATFASGVVTLDNRTGGGLYENVAPGDLVLYNPDTEKLYRNTATFTLNPGQLLTGVAIAALEAGSASTSTKNTIVAFQTPWTDVTVTNPAAVLGFDEEDDPSLRIRAREVLGARSANGPEDAYNAAARRAKLIDGTPINVNRTKIRRDGRGNVYLYVAKEAGAVSGTLSDPTSELARVNDEVQRTATPLGITARVSSARALAKAYTGTIYLTDKKGFSDADLNAAVVQALGKYLGQAPIGGFVIAGEQGKLYLDDVRAHARILDSIFRVTLDQTVDTVLQPDQFVTLTSATFAISLQKQPTLSSYFTGEKVKL